MSMVSMLSYGWISTASCCPRPRISVIISMISRLVAVKCLPPESKKRILPNFPATYHSADACLFDDQRCHCSEEEDELQTASIKT